VISAYTFCTGTSAVESPAIPGHRAWMAAYHYRFLRFWESRLHGDWEGA
jgi:hypothetical protein